MNSISPASAITESSKKTRSGVTQSDLKSKTMLSGIRDENAITKKCVLTVKSRATISSNHSSTHSPSNSKQSNSAFSLRLSLSGEKAEKVRIKFNQYR